MRMTFFLLALVGFGAGGTLWWRATHSADGPQVRTAPVERRDLVVNVSSTGTVQAEELVDVGAQVNGRIIGLGPDYGGKSDPELEALRASHTTDVEHAAEVCEQWEAHGGQHINYRTEVEKGQILAVIDPSIYKAQRNQAKAALEHSVADLAQLEAKEIQAQAEWDRAQRLQKLAVDPRAAPASGAPATSGTIRPASLQIQAISNSDFILAKANYQIAKANVDVGSKTIDQQSAALALAETNVVYTVILSPVKGTVIDRRVNIGQTVVSSMNASSLFLIAKDLTKMEVWASVNEADVGQIHKGQKVSFTVDAFPEDKFIGFVKQLRYNATMTQNVVTYTVIIGVDNPDLKLIPYLTADIQFEVVKHDNVLVVPNAALRFQPSPEKVVGGDEAAEGSSKGRGRGGRGGQSRGGEGGGEHVAGASKRGVLWKAEGKMYRAVPVVLGPTDGTSTEVSGDGVDENLEVVISEVTASPAGGNEQVNNPFAPRFPGRGGGGGGGGRGGFR